MTFNKDEPYFIEARYLRVDKADHHFTVSVEIENGNGIQEHHSPMYERQLVSLQAETKFEKTTFEVDSPHQGGSYRILFTDPNLSEDRFITDVIQANATASDFYDAIKGYYTKKMGCDINVTLTMYDAE